MQGYVGAEHRFGRSSLIRLGSNYYIRWQRRKNKKEKMKDIHELTRKQYNEIKALIGPIKNKDVQPTSKGYKAVLYLHETNTKYHMRVRRYLERNEII